ncbi:hypothetical protein AVEN_266224-1 [Araneus ventricosus]|uniref:Uncharacterized protein n=1 Tax=Araneus ventricosus TaxID=182803 RepID=A0A4Y2LNJ5_ARAVE|nr:hypothetical protein AVEN_266224-1 [Araneus ventricosus]
MFFASTMQSFQPNYTKLTAYVTIWPGGKVSASGPEGYEFKTRYRRGTAVQSGLVSTKPSVLPLVWCGRLEREMPAQVSSSSYGHGSKLLSCCCKTGRKYN